MSIEQIVALKAETEAKWTTTITTEVDRIFREDPELTQLQACRIIKGELVGLFESYPGWNGIRVNPKGDKEIQVILTLDELGSNPYIKIKPRFKVPILNVEVAHG